MKSGSTFFLRAVIVILGLVVIGLCIYILPFGISTDITGMYRPILLGMYLPAIPFFVALFEALKLLDYIDKSQAFSELSVKSIKKIKYCASIIGALFVLGMPYIFYVADKDDAPGVAAIGFVIIFASIVIAVFAAVLQKLLQNAIDIKKENELTV